MKSKPFSLTQFQLSTLKRIGIEVNESSLTLLDSKQVISFREIRSLSIEKPSISIEKKLMKVYYILLKLSNLSIFDSANFDGTRPVITKMIVITLMNEKRICFHKSNIDLISITKIFKLLNKEINQPFKYRV